MSEYWKSTPKYWCKFCKTYVRDTKTERQQHDATGRHQGNIQRSLRNLHRDNEREEREKQRAKDEVARLNGIVSGTPVASSSSSSSSLSASKFNHSNNPPPVAAPTQTGLEERKARMKQLADMGVAIPDQFRGDLALAGEWETVSEKNIDSSKIKSAAPLSFGVRKRKLAEDEEEEQEEDDHDGPKAADGGGLARRKADWSSRYRSYPDATRGVASTDDIEALLSRGSTLQNDPKLGFEDLDKAWGEKSSNDKIGNAGLEDELKAEPPTPEDKLPPAETTNLSAAAADDDAAPVVFKKRKAKAAKAK